MKPHGFVWPSGLPDCGLCGEPAANRLHVTPGPSAGVYGSIFAAVVNSDQGYRRSHAYVLRDGLIKNILCAACRAPLDHYNHPIGMASGDMPATPVRASEGPREQAFVAQMGDRIVLAARGRSVDAVGELPESMSRVAAEMVTPDGPHLWLVGRYVQADAPNRNAAYWSTEDLEIGQPTVAHGPINWLHEEKHIIGTIAASELVTGEREAAGEIGNHIIALGAVWPWLWPVEARMVADASRAGELWFSMECISRSVSCLADECGREMAYADYMRRQNERCDHMKDGAPRRFVDPIFNGAGIIIPPVRPGWADANAKVLMPRASAMAERQAAAFEGMSTEDAESLVATLLASVGGDQE